jgi:hypothetical protein
MPTHNVGPGNGCGESHASANLSPERAAVRFVQEVGCFLGPVWTDAENLAPTGIQIPQHPTSSELLHPLLHPIRHIKIWVF